MTTLDRSEAELVCRDESSTAAPRSVLLVLEVFVALRFLLPSNMTVGPIGQVGSPATLWGLLCLLWYCTSLLWKGSGVHRGRQPIHWAFLILLLAWLLSYAVLPIRNPDLFERSGADRDLLVLLSMMGVGLLAADGLEDRHQFLRLCRFVCLVWAVSCSVALLQFVGYDVMEWVTRIPGFSISGTLSSVEQRGAFQRAAGTTSHPIEFAVITAMVLPMALQLQPWERHRRRWSLIVLVTLLAVAASISRSGVVGVAVGLVVLGVSWPPRRRHKAVLYGLALSVVLFLGVPGLVGTVSRLFVNASTDASITTRTDDYAAVQPYIVERPWLGRGVGTFMPPRYRILDNQYLLTLIEAGAVGVGALVAFFLISIIAARDGWCHASPGPSRDAARAVMASLIVAALAMAFFDGFSFESFTGTLFLFVGLAGAAWRVSRPSEPPDAVTAVSATPQRTR